MPQSYLSQIRMQRSTIDDTERRGETTRTDAHLGGKRADGERLNVAVLDSVLCALGIHVGTCVDLRDLVDWVHHECRQYERRPRTG